MVIENEMLCKFKNWYHNSFVRYRVCIYARRAGQSDMLHETRQADETWQPVEDKNIYPKNERQLQVAERGEREREEEDDCRRRRRRLFSIFTHTRERPSRETIRYIAAKEIESNSDMNYMWSESVKVFCPLDMPLLK